MKIYDKLNPFKHNILQKNSILFVMKFLNNKIIFNKIINKLNNFILRNNKYNKNLIKKI